MTPPDAPTPPASVAEIHRHLAGLLYSVIGDPNFLSDDMVAQPHYWTIRRKAETIAAARPAGYAAGVRCTQEELRPYTRHLPFCERYFATGTYENAACSCGLDRALAPRPDGAEKEETE